MAQLPTRPASAAVAAFLDKAAAVPALRPVAHRPGRLVFAVDATASRQPGWDMACQLQTEMFQAAAAHGGLEVSLAYYRGFGEFAATPFLSDGPALARRMAGVQCLGGRTQIGRVLDHALREAARERLHALVFVGDAVEEEPDPLCHQAGQLGLRGTPAFIFQEGHDPKATAVLRQLAKLSGGAHAPFDAASASALRDLLRAVGAYAAGGHDALSRLSSPAARALLAQLPAPTR
ncbi:vWA domain-containing protein [Roseomonas marmotae]|uniref:VWA domain-containing protein n=1 Tax=Roseomonas marmotae TaxID=2768161 RepID=A0ABS3K6R0_9PROT|nr:VWA domain-containing protein [Roseomonas marmotae]MBO1073144.1 VWA domain-containing protein [Roseomonas marmotae]QTI79220.1 VWA domain-containing protein [Roseomonas marmotae]